MGTTKRAAVPLSPKARTHAFTVLSVASVAMGAPVIAGFVHEQDATAELLVHLGCALSTLTLTVALLSACLSSGSPFVRLFFFTPVAAMVNTAVCATLALGPDSTFAAIVIGAFVWIPVGLGYFVLFGAYLAALGTIEKTPSRDLPQRRAALGAVLFGALACLGAPLASAAPRFALFTAAAAALAAVLALSTLARDARDRLFLRAVARGQRPQFLLREAAPDDDGALPAFVAGLRAPDARWVILERARTDAGPFRDQGAERPRFTVADRAAPLLRRAALCATLTLLALGIGAMASAFLVPESEVATLLP